MHSVKFMLIIFRFAFLPKGMHKAKCNSRTSRGSCRSMSDIRAANRQRGILRCLMFNVKPHVIF